MRDDFLGRDQYYDFPSFEVALFSLLLAFVLSSVIGLTYRITFEGDRFPRHFFQAIVLSSTVTSMVIMAVGNNLAAGFGIIGAVAIIRFRTLVRDPRNIIFIFASLSVGIATGVYGYAIALAGTFIFSVIAFLLHYSPFGKSAKSNYEISFSLSLPDSKNIFESEMAKMSVKARIVRMRTGLENIPRYTYHVVAGQEVGKEQLFDTLLSIPGVSDIRVAAAQEVEL